MPTHTTLHASYQMQLLVTVRGLGLNKRTRRITTFKRVIASLGNNPDECILKAKSELVEMPIRQNIHLTKHVDVLNVRKDNQCPGVIILDIPKG